MLSFKRLFSSKPFFNVIGVRPATAGVALFTLVLAGCISQPSNQNLSSSVTSIPADKGIVVIGMKGNAAGSFRRGTYSSDGSFEHDTARDAEFSAPGEQPYIVQAMSVTTEDSRYGMYRASLGGREYSFKCGQVLPVLSVASGVVQYYGDFQVSIDDGRLTVKQSFDMERAQRFIDSNYPASGWKLEPGKVVRARSTNCVVAPPAAIVG